MNKTNIKRQITVFDRSACSEQEYRDFWVIRAKNKKEADKVAKAELIENYGRTKEDWDSEDEYLDNNETHHEIAGVSRITKSKLEVLRELLSVYTVNA